MPHNEQGIAQGFAEPPFEGVAVGSEPPMVEGARPCGGEDGRPEALVFDGSYAVLRDGAKPHLDAGVRLGL